MLKIKDKIYNSRDFKPLHVSESDEYKKNDKKIASDNIEVQPLQATAVIFYKGDVNEGMLYIEDIMYNQELITVTDIDNGREYGDLYISSFGITKYYLDGFVANISFGYIPITETAMAGKKTYTGYSSRNIKTVQKPLKLTTIATANLPSTTLNSLNEIGVNTNVESLTLKSLDFSSFGSFIDSASDLAGNVSQKIQSTIGDFTGVFELSPDGTFDILNKAGEKLSMGQKLFSNVELLLDTIPGVDVSMKILPLTEKASNEIFDLNRLGSDFILNVSEVKNSLGLGGR